MDKRAFEVIATTLDGRDITRGYVDYLPLLPPTDPVLRYRYGTWFGHEAYRDLLSDDQVYSTATQRRLALIARAWEVTPGGKMRRDKAAADFIREILRHVRWDTVCERMWYAIFYGYAVAECLWQRDGRTIVLDEIRVRNHARFGFDPQFNLKLLTTHKPDGEALPEKKFWHIATGATHDDEPYGIGLGHYLYWPVFFKRNGMRFWLKFLDKFGGPSAVGRYPAGTPEADQNKLLEAAGRLRSDSAVIIPEGMSLELLEASRPGRPEYGGFHQVIDAAIAKVVVGQTMTTDAGSSRSQAEVHYAVREEKVTADAHLIDDSFTRSVARWLTEWNFPGAAIPKVMRVFEAGTAKERAERDKILFDMGYRPTRQYIEDNYGVEVEDIGTPPLADNAPDDNPSLHFAEFEQILDSINEGNLQNISEQLMRSLIAQIEHDPTVLLGAIAERYPDMDETVLQDTLARIIFVAETWGRLNARGG